MANRKGERGVSPLSVKRTLSSESLALVPVTLGKDGIPSQIPESKANDEIPVGVSERDWLAWRCMRDVLTYMYDQRSKNILAACEGTGWPRWYWYEIRDNEYVQSEMMRLANVNRAAEFMAINAKWMEVLNAQIQVAVNQAQTDPRASTAAATWLGRRLDAITDDSDAALGDKAGRKSRARRNLEMLMENAAGSVTIERTERITVGERGDTVEGEVIKRDVDNLTP